MEYLALYRKYRPQQLDEVVGQSEIKKILASSIENGTITHAYLFSGPRGTGKTTMAKILAKMVNCEHPINGNACNECDTCKNILNSNDVIEIDAASNNGVDEIRELREKATLVPSTCKYKVYIIDEVHMLTTQAFNALLKTLEEPPKHVIFILATTEYYKIPLTITSRCQKFQFNKITNEDIVDRLKEIANKEKISIDDDALYEIAKISDGGMRDSINFLDQLRSFTNDKINVVDVYNVCGSLSVSELTDLLLNVRDNKISDVVEFFEKMNANGKNYSKFLEDLISFLKDVILYKNDVSNKYIKSNPEFLTKIVNCYSNDDIYYIIEELNKLFDRLKLASRQTVVITTSFLVIMNNLNVSDNISGNSNVVNSEKKEEKVDYEMAFDFTDNEKNKESKLTHVDVNNDIIDTKKNVEIDKEVIINNTFAVANRNVKLDLQKKMSLIEEFLTDKKFSLAAGVLVDVTIEAAGEGYVIFSGKYGAVVDKINDNYELCNEFIDKIFEGKYKYVVIAKEEWDKYRDEYINNTKNGMKYELKNIDSKVVIKKDKKKKDPTIVDKLFDLVGEENIEFK